MKCYPVNSSSPPKKNHVPPEIGGLEDEISVLKWSPFQVTFVGFRGTEALGLQEHTKQTPSLMRYDWKTRVGDEILPSCIPGLLLLTIIKAP